MVSLQQLVGGDSTKSQMVGTSSLIKDGIRLSTTQIELCACRCLMVWGWCLAPCAVMLEILSHQKSLVVAFFITWQTLRVHGRCSFLFICVLSSFMSSADHRHIRVWISFHCVHKLYEMNWIGLVVVLNFVACKVCFKQEWANKNWELNVNWTDGIDGVKSWDVGGGGGVFYSYGWFYHWWVQWGESTRCHKRGYILSWNEVWVGLGY